MTMAPALAAIDPALPHLEAALDRRCAHEAIAGSKRFLGARVDVAAARLMRHKPGKRAVIAYTLDVVWPGGHAERIAAIGKMRAARPPRTAYRLLRELWRHGFDAGSPDGISVPEPLGTVPTLGLWLQRQVPGVVATALLPGPDGRPLARRIARAAHKVHGCGVVPERSHAPADELAILERVLGEVAHQRPAWRAKVTSLLIGCRRLVARLDGPTTSIHRDFYADQVIVDGDRLHLLDFDLFCQGHAALDLGNFAGHLREQAIRQPLQAHALDAAGDALEQEYHALSGGAAVEAMRIYTTLTLARHVYLSVVLPGRNASTEDILDASLAAVEAQP